MFDILRVDIKTEIPLHKSSAFCKTYIFRALNSKNKFRNFSLGELHMFTNNITLVSIDSDDKYLFKKCREIWNKITELIGIDDPTDVVETTFDNNEDEFIMLELEKNTSAVRDKHRNDLAFVFHPVLNEFPQTLLV